MEKEKAIEIFNKWMDCKDAYQADPSCDGNCFSCEYYASAEEEKEAMQMAISALKKQEQERWRPTAEKEPDVNCLARDKFGQIFIPQCGIINITAGNKRKSFDCPADFDVSDINAFFKGKEVGNGMRILPKEILAWRPLPEPYTEEES